MTLAPEAPIQTRELHVRTGPEGKPLAVRHDGKIWLVDPETEPQRWLGGNASRDGRRAAAAEGGDPVSVEYWRIQVRLGASSALRTFTLRREPSGGRWLLDDINDAG
jgi:hypothetical protein